jgi:hypothetical protein
MSQTEQSLHIKSVSPKVKFGYLSGETTLAEIRDALEASGRERLPVLQTLAMHHLVQCTEAEYAS